MARGTAGCWVKLFSGELLDCHPRHLDGSAEVMVPLRMGAAPQRPDWWGDCDIAFRLRSVNAQQAAENANTSGLLHINRSAGQMRQKEVQTEPPTGKHDAIGYGLWRPK